MHRRLAGSLEQPASVKAAEEHATPRDTIAAISTPAGEGAIALIRISGEDAIGVAERIYRGKEKPSEFPIAHPAPGRDLRGGSIDRSGHALGSSRAGQLHGRRFGGDQLPRWNSRDGARPRSLFPCRGARRAAGRIFRARLPKRQNGSDPGGSGHGFDPRPERSRASLRQRATGRTARRRDQGHSGATDRDARACGSRDRFSGGRHRAG